MMSKENTEPVTDLYDEEHDDVYPTVKKFARGMVSNCGHLNIRKAPAKAAEIAAMVPADTIVAVDLDKSTDDWYAIWTAWGIEGFCMRDFITIIPDEE